MSVVSGDVMEGNGERMVMVSLVPWMLAMSSRLGQPAHVGIVPDQYEISEPEVVSESKLAQSLSVVLPAYNEEAIIEQTVTTVAAALRRWTDNFEIIVVNDGSKDHTRDIIERLIGDEPRIRLMHHSQNRGYGAALITGFHTVSKDLVFFMDSDGQFDINDLESFFPLIERFDAVLGYRAPRHDPWIRKLNAWGWKQLVYLTLGIKVRDLDCAFKLYRAEFFQTLNLETRGAMINAEILYKFTCAGHTYTEVGVKHLPRQKGQATGAHPRVILKALSELITYSRKWKLAERTWKR